MSKKLAFVLILALVLSGAFFKLTSVKADTGSSPRTDSVTVTTTVTPYISIGLDPTTVALGNLFPGTPVVGSAGTVATVSTNAANGYTLAIHDGVASTDSALLHTDTTTRIADYAGTIAIPTSWTSTGLGITNYAADTSKNAKWGTGTTYNDANNKYAGIPTAATVAHTVTGYLAGADTSSWAFKADVANTQKTGAYSGVITFTATAVLS